jgi:hypothetical protein
LEEAGEAADAFRGSQEIEELAVVLRVMLPLPEGFPVSLVRIYIY